MAELRKTEDRHHSGDEVRGYIDEALAIVRDAELDDELRPLAFAKALDLLASKQVFYEPVASRVAGLDGRALG